MKQNVGCGKVIGEFQMDMTQRIGKGSFGEVYLGKNQNTQEIVAIKMIQAKNDQQRKQNEIFQKEIDIMKQLNHPNLVKFITSYITANNLYVVMEYCEGGTLNEYIQKKLSNQGLKYLSESEAIIILKQLILGYKEMYNKKIVHRDLKPANILIRYNVVKITDFGFGKCLQNYNNDLLQTFAGSPLYMSPQILYQNQQYTTKTDIWSLGIIFYEVLFGKPPWNVSTMEQLYHCVKQKKLQFPTFPLVSQQMKNIISKMIEFEEKDRMSWEELFQLQVFMDQQNFEDIKKSVFQIKNEQNNFNRINLEKNVYFRGVAQNLQQAREQQQEVERQYPKIRKHSSNSVSPNQSDTSTNKSDTSTNKADTSTNKSDTSTNKADTSTSPRASRNKERIFSERKASPSPNQTLTKIKIQNEQEYIKNKNIIEEISNWITHKKNKSLFLNSLTTQMFELLSDGKYLQDRNIYNIVCFTLTKYQLMIFYRTLNRLKKQQIDGTTKRYNEEQWKIFCKSHNFKTAYEIISKDYNLLKSYLTNLLNPTENSISILNNSVFNEAKQICNMQYIPKKQFDACFDKIIQIYFRILQQELIIEKLELNYLQFLLNLKNCTKIHTMFKFKNIDYFKYFDELKSLARDQLIILILG